MWMLALGRGISPGVVERPVAHIDVAATAAAMLGVKGGAMHGTPLTELL